MPAATSYVIQASGLTKIFLPEWEAKCIQDPSIITNGHPFKVTIPRACGAIVMEHNKPIHTSQLIRYTGNRKVDRDETKDLVMWLTDEMSGETDIYGVVALDIDMTVNNSIQSMLSNPDMLSEDPAVRERAMRAQMDIQGQLMQRMKDAIATARARADARVKKQLKITHHNLIKQYESNQAAGGGMYPPSATEALGAWILAEEIKKATEAKQKMVDNLTGMMGRTRVG